MFKNRDKNKLSGIGINLSENCQESGIKLGQIFKFEISIFIKHFKQIVIFNLSKFTWNKIYLQQLYHSGGDKYSEPVDAFEDKCCIVCGAKIDS